MGFESLALIVVGGVFVLAGVGLVLGGAGLVKLGDPGQVALIGVMVFAAKTLCHVLVAVVTRRRSPPPTKEEATGDSRGAAVLVVILALFAGVLLAGLLLLALGGCSGAKVHVATASEWGACVLSESPACLAPFADPSLELGAAAIKCSACVASVLIGCSEVPPVVAGGVSRRARGNPPAELGGCAERVTRGCLARSDWPACVAELGAGCLPAGHQIE